jgi:glycosyltransferase involved in cell wall biosynthesis
VEKGLDFVTLTDHNTMEGSLYLKEKYPDRVFTGVESTAYFPEDECKIHILIYGLSDAQFRMIEKKRKNIYTLRDYLRSENLAHSVAHATYPVNGRLTQTHLEKLIVLFDTFEAINGARDHVHNDGWETILRSLTEGDIERLAHRHRLEPFGKDSWKKGFTGGSDDHAGLFLARTWTETPADSPEDFVAAIRDRNSVAGGREGNFQSLAFSIYKIAWDFSQQRGKKLAGNFLMELTGYLFGRKKLSLWDRLRLRSYRSLKADEVRRILHDLVMELSRLDGNNIDERLTLVYDRVSDIADELFRALFKSAGKSMGGGDLGGLFKNLSASLPAVFLSAPFITTYNHLHVSPRLLRDLGSTLEKQPFRDLGKKILWFTDTISDLNGVSVTLRKIGHLAHEEGRDLLIVASLPENAGMEQLPPNLLNLPAVASMPLPFYEKLQLHIPSILTSLRELHDFNPDAVYISSPGPIGLLGLAVAKLSGVPAYGVYHTDFTEEARRIAGEEGPHRFVESFMRWFYSACDEIRVPSREYIRLLSERGYDDKKMKIFPRGIDSGTFRPIKPAEIAPLPGIADGTTLLYAGRISKDKNLEFLAGVFENVQKTHPKLNLVIAGDGPYLGELKKRLSHNRRVLFTGRLPNKDLVRLYNLSHYLVFPSVTDTFGMVVLEAQACGLPALVSTVGGPQEIISDGHTGWSLSVDNPRIWELKISDLVRFREDREDEYALLRTETRTRTVSRHDWKEVMADYFGDTVRPEPGVAPETNEPRTAFAKLEPGWRA